LTSPRSGALRLDVASCRSSLHLPRTHRPFPFLRRDLRASEHTAFSAATSCNSISSGEGQDGSLAAWRWPESNQLFYLTGWGLIFSNPTWPLTGFYLTITMPRPQYHWQKPLTRCFVWFSN
jgi:hypothetical protein